AILITRPVPLCVDPRLTPILDNLTSLRVFTPTWGGLDAAGSALTLARHSANQNRRRWNRRGSHDRAHPHSGTAHQWNQSSALCLSLLRRGLRAAHLPQR